MQSAIVRVHIEVWWPVNERVEFSPSKLDFRRIHKSREFSRKKGRDMQFGLGKVVPTPNRWIRSTRVLISLKLLNHCFDQASF